MTTYHNDNNRDGVQPNEGTLTQSVVQGGSFGFIGQSSTTASTTIDGLIYAQPLYLHGITMKISSNSTCSGSMNIVTVASENNTVYAFSVDNSTLGSFKMTKCWSTPLNKSGEYAIPFDQLPGACNNIIPQSGITSTPVIDTSVTPPIMYVVSAHVLAGGGAYTYRLHAIQVNTGIEAVTAYDIPTAINNYLGDPTDPFAAIAQNQRVSLALYRPATGQANIYVGFGSFCDAQPPGDVYSGYLAAFQLTFGNGKTPAFSTLGVFDSEASDPNNKPGGGIWMGGGAPALDANNNLYIAVGNGVFNGGSGGNLPQDFGHSIVKLTSATVTPVDFYTPNDFAILNSNKNANPTCLVNSASGSCPAPLAQNSITIPAPGDFDVGSGGVTLISPAVPSGSGNPLCPSNQQLVAGGKEGVLYDACYSTSTSSSPQSTMGGLDSCGYSCNSVAASYSAATACTQSSALPTAGSIAQCFPGINVLNTYLNGAPGSRATAAFWAGNPLAGIYENYLYVAGSGDTLNAYHMSSATWQFTYPGSSASSPSAFGYPGASPALSWNSTSTSTAVLWVVNVSKAGSGSKTTTTAASPAQLFAFNPIPSGSVINPLFSDTVKGPGGVKYAVPTIADGLVFVAGGVQGYSPGLAGSPPSVNCSPAAYYSGSGSSCPGLLVVYGQTK